jgi:hypothetical protein
MSWFQKKDGKTEHCYVEERLSAYLDGELSAKERSLVERHLTTCEECRWSLDTLRQTVQWTRELPTVSLPRVFTIPVAAKPAPARRLPWFVPVLQGATALVAVLLVFVVAVDYVLPGAGVSVSEPSVWQEAAPALDDQSLREVEVTVVAEAEEIGVVESVVVEKAAPEPTLAPTSTHFVMVAESPLPQPASPTEEARVMAEVALTATAESGPMGVMGFETPAGEEEAEGASSAIEAPVEAAEEVTATETVEVLPTPTLPPTAIPTESPRLPAPTVVAEAPEPPAAAGGGEQRAVVIAQRSDPLTLWLGVGEIVLCIALVLLGAATIFVMVWQRKSR